MTTADTTPDAAGDDSVWDDVLPDAAGTDSQEETTEATDDDEVTTGEEHAPASKVAREAARWRTRYREADAGWTAERATVDRLRRAEVLRLASGDLAQPDDIFEIGRLDLAGVLDEAGDVDPGLVATVVHALTVARPGLRKPPPEHRRDFPDFGAGKRGGTAPTSKSWSSVLRGED